MKYFIFHNTTDDTQDAIVDLSSISSAQLDITDYTITIGFYNAPAIVVDFCTEVNTISEFLRLTSEMTMYADKIESEEGAFMHFFSGGQLDD